MYINVREKQRGNQQWTIHKQWQHGAHQTQGEDKQSKLKKKHLTTQKTKKMTNTEPSRSKMYVMYIIFFIYRQLT